MSDNPVTITVLRGGRDQHGDPLPTAPHDIADCIVYPRYSSENDTRGEQVIVGKAVLAPPGADILATDQVRIDGVVYDVEGEPGDWSHPFVDWHAGVQVALTRSS